MQEHSRPSCGNRDELSCGIEPLTSRNITEKIIEEPTHPPSSGMASTTGEFNSPKPVATIERARDARGPAIPTSNRAVL